VELSNAEIAPTCLTPALPRSHGISLSAPWSSAGRATIGAPDADSEEDEAVCVVCMARPPDFQLLPCRHDRFCQQCMVETICTWVRPEAPSCPLCRAPFHTMVLLE
jgi:hypothetical protein